MSSVEENCLDPDSPCSLSPSVISSLASSLAATHTVLVTVAPDSHNSIHLTAGAEVGIAIGAVFLVISLGSLVSVLRRRRRRGRHVSEIDLGDPSSPIMAEAGYPHFPRLPGESVSSTSLVNHASDRTSTVMVPGQDGAANANVPRDGILAGPQRTVASSEKRQAARDARNGGRLGGDGGGQDRSSAEGDVHVQAVPLETDGGVRLAGGRLHPPEEGGDGRRGGSSEAGTVPPPPYAEY